MILLKDGRRFERAMIVGGMITSIDNNPDVPFRESDIDQIVAHTEGRGLACGDEEIAK